MRCRQKKSIGEEPIGEAGFKEKGKYETGTKIKCTENVP